MRSANSFGDMISSVAKTTNQSWPFVAIPDFEVHAQNLRKMVRADVIVMTPLIDYSLRSEWNNFSRSRIDWWRESREQAGLPISPENYQDEMKDLYSFAPFFPDTKPDRFHVPYWQGSPPAAINNINIDYAVLGDTDGHRQAVLKFRQHIFGDMFDYNGYVSDDGTKTFLVGEHDKLHADFTDSAPNEGREKPGWASEYPHTSCLFPVFEVPGDSSSKIVALLFFTLTWDAYITNLLPQGTPDMLVVIKGNTFKQDASFIVRGNNVIFQGMNDTHSSKYDDKKKVLDLTAKTGITETDGRTTTLYKLEVYPTDALVAYYEDSTPLVFTVIVSLSFAVMIATFFAYDLLVTRRNKKVVLTAAKSNAIVSSLFPSTVRDRLFDEQQLELQQKQKRDAMIAFRRDNDSDSGNTKGKPIADLFPESTIMFADLAGFTAWSAKREPSDVFLLLETIYNSFDA